MAPRKKKAGGTTPPLMKIVAGSPITIDGGGSISITFREVDYPQGGDPDDNDGGAGTRIKTVKVKDALGRELDLSPTVSTTSPELNRIKVSYRDSNNPMTVGVIKIKSAPLGVRFSRSVFQKVGPGVFRNPDLEITAVEVRYQGGWERITFDNPAVGKGTIRVDLV